MRKKYNIFFGLLVCLFFLSGIIQNVFGENGVSGDTIVIGQSCALSGPSQALGTELKTGAEAYLNKINSEGGVQGRKIKLVSLDDGYEPDKCIENTRKLINEEKVFLLFGYVGTPTTQAALPIMEESKVPLVGPFTGSVALRDPQKKIYNIRANYDQETSELVKSFSKNLGLKKIACLYQNDAYGKAGLSGVEKALKAEGLDLAGSASYERNTVAVKSAVAQLSQVAPDAVVMVGAYKPCAEFIKLAKELGMTGKFANISFVGTTKLVEEVGSAGDGTYISQVMPSPADTSVPVVKECTTVLGRQPTYGELEGFVDAKVLVEAFKRTGQNVTRQTFEAAVEGMKEYDAGGLPISFGPDDHQGSDKVFFTKIESGKAVSIEKIQ